MDASELAKQMLLWEQVRRHLDEIEEAIKDTVLQIGKTQTVGNVRASYSGGRKQYDYATAAENIEISMEDLEAYITKSVDYRKLCLDYKVDAPFTQSAPSVSIKLLE